MISCIPASSHFLVGGTYRVSPTRIGSGGFSEVVLGMDMGTRENVAVKLERRSSRYPQLLREHQLYEALEGADGLPRIRWFGRAREYNVLVMDLLGPSLEDLFNICGRQFSLQTILLLADQMLERLQFIHDNSIIHRDLKPNNMVMGLGDKANKLFLIDFGLAEVYRTSYFHLSYNQNKTQGVAGTAGYTSLNAHLGIRRSRRDDMESIGYILVYFLRRGLPWIGLDASNKEALCARIFEVKSTTTIETLCQVFSGSGRGGSVRDNVPLVFGCPHLIQTHPYPTFLMSPDFPTGYTPMFISGACNQLQEWGLFWPARNASARNGANPYEMKHLFWINLGLDGSKGCPPEFATYLNYCRGLAFEEGPDYKYLRSLFRRLYRKLFNNGEDAEWDWTRFMKDNPPQLTTGAPNQGQFCSNW
ncbi:Casein kinase I isoform alpha [Folsomia candida]|uniref:non-specific serine/threonine protein kinase n=1 Tax=Folsomia candida TaxID=158441 RepID=A0A226D023_FOLCA|nr:Casein kinase I isoform alpha [Folsomia candida]